MVVKNPMICLPSSILVSFNSAGKFKLHRSDSGTGYSSSPGAEPQAQLVQNFCRVQM
jgi:hypothetical protein